MDATNVSVVIKFTANGQENSVQADRFPYVIGRDGASVQLVLADEAVSPIHARLTIQDGAVWLESAGADSRTEVNGQPVSGPTVLRDGDQAVLGATQLTFEIKQAAAQEPEQAGTAYCRNCGNQMRAGAVFCTGCGQPVDAGLSGETTFCRSCGAKIDKSSKFCPVCGQPLQAGAVPQGQVQGGSVSTGVSGGTKKLPIPIIAGVAAAVVLVIILIATLGGGGGYKNVAKNYIEGMFEADFEKIWKLVPKDVQEEALDNSGYDDDEADKLIKDMNKRLKRSFDYLEDEVGKNWKYSYEIVDEDDLKKKDISSLEDDLEDMGVKKPDIQEAKKLEVEVSIEGKDDDIEETIYITVYKMGGKWYLGNFDL